MIDAISFNLPHGLKLYLKRHHQAGIQTTKRIVKSWAKLCLRVDKNSVGKMYLSK